MKKFLMWLALVIVLYVVQSSFLSLIYFHGVGPDLLLLVTASFGFLKGSRMGSFMGFMLGLFEDLAVGGFFGLNTFSKLLIGLCCGVFSNRVLRDSFFLPVAAAFNTTIAKFVIFEVIILLLGYGFYPITHIQYKLFPMLCYNIIFAWPVYSVVNWLNKKTADKK